MKPSLSCLFLFACATLALSAVFGQEVESGPKGRHGGHFEVNVITGPLKGQKDFCYVCKFAGEQIPATVMIFAQKADEHLATLIRAVDAEAKRDTRLSTVLVGIGGLNEADLLRFQDAHQVVMPLTVANDKDGPKRYSLNKEAAVTVLVYELGGVIHGSFGFRDTRSAAAKTADIVDLAKKVRELRAKQK